MTADPSHRHGFDPDDLMAWRRQQDKETTVTARPRVVCPACGRSISTTAAGRIRYHNPPGPNQWCRGSYTETDTQ